MFGKKKKKDKAEEKKKEEEKAKKNLQGYVSEQQAGPTGFDAFLDMLFGGLFR